MIFNIDEKVSIESILIALETEGVKTGDVAKAIPGISEKPLRNALKAAGYEFRNQAPKGWYFIGEGEKPLNRSIFDYVNKSSSSKKSTSQTVRKQVTPSNTEFTKSNTEKVIPSSPVVHEQFTQDEIKMIKEMLKTWQQAAPQGVVQVEQYEHGGRNTTVHERIKALPQEQKTRKTIVIDKTIGNSLDLFCKVERVNKSDVLHLALIDFLNKYQGETT